MFSPESIVGSEALIDNQKFSNVSAMPKKASKVYETRSRNNFLKSFNNKTNIIVQRKQLKTIYFKYSNDVVFRIYLARSK